MYMGGSVYVGGGASVSSPFSVADVTHPPPLFSPSFSLSFYLPPQASGAWAALALGGAAFSRAFATWQRLETGRLVCAILGGAHGYICICIVCECALPSSLLTASLYPPPLSLAHELSAGVARAAGRRGPREGDEQDEGAGVKGVKGASVDLAALPLTHHPFPPFSIPPFPLPPCPQDSLLAWKRRAQGVSLQLSSPTLPPYRLSDPHTHTYIHIQPPPPELEGDGGLDELDGASLQRLLAAQALGYERTAAALRVQQML